MKRWLYFNRQPFHCSRKSMFGLAEGMWGWGFQRINESAGPWSPELKTPYAKGYKVDEGT